jgi:hypothetical protein
MTKQQKWRKKIAAELESLRVASGDGSLSPVAILAWASAHPKSALYGTFEWDDTKAAKEHRLWQARQMIHTYEVVHLEQPEQGMTSIPLISVPSRRRGSNSDEGSYVRRDVIMDRPDYRQSVLAEQIKLLETMRTNYGWLSELDDVWAVIDNIKDVASAA